MKLLARSVLIMESLVMGFAILIAQDKSNNLQIALGGLIALLAILTAGFLRSPVGWIMGWAIQFAMIAYGLIVSTMFFMGSLFLILWVAAIVVGKKGEAIRATLAREQGSGKGQ